MTNLETQDLRKHRVDVPEPCHSGPLIIGYDNLVDPNKIMYIR